MALSCPSSVGSETGPSSVGSETGPSSVGEESPTSSDAELSSDSRVGGEGKQYDDVPENTGAQVKPY